MQRCARCNQCIPCLLPQSIDNLVLFMNDVAMHTHKALYAPRECYNYDWLKFLRQGQSNLEDMLSQHQWKVKKRDKESRRILMKRADDNSKQVWLYIHAHEENEIESIEAVKVVGIDY